MKLEPNQTKNERDIRRIMIAGTAIGFGFMAASLEALGESHSGFSFHISWRTYVAFVLGAAVVVPFWKVAFSLATKNQTRSRHIWIALLFLLVGIAAFLYPTRFVPGHKRAELYTGLVIAVCALGICATLIIMVGRHLLSDKTHDQDEGASDKSRQRQ